MALVQLTIAASGLLALLLFMLANRRGSPLPAIFARWARWLFIGLGCASLLRLLGWSGYPLTVLLPVCLILWFLLESTYMWLAIRALNQHQLPLFPKFRASERPHEWPSQPRFIRLRELLRAQGLELEQALTAELDAAATVRAFIYADPKRTLRVNVLLLPNVRGNFMASLACDSCFEDGSRLITDNTFLPFGGFYPENWNVERRPWLRNPLRLIQRHHERLDAANRTPVAFSMDPEDQMLADLRKVEAVNRELGFLHDSVDVEISGRITPAGRSRVWQELLMLAYLGRPFRYN
jgi:hypothetical protein